jgi:ATP-dependent protease ClpP protease subunit
MAVPSKDRSDEGFPGDFHLQSGGGSVPTGAGLTSTMVDAERSASASVITVAISWASVLWFAV